MRPCILVCSLALLAPCAEAFHGIARVHGANLRSTGDARRHVGVVALELHASMQNVLSRACEAYRLATECMTSAVPCMRAVRHLVDTHPCFKCTTGAFVLIEA